MTRDLDPQAEAARFYAGYGDVALNSAALAYFRCERIIQDLAVDGDEIVGLRGSEAERRQALHYFSANFEPERTIELAMATAIA